MEQYFYCIIICYNKKYVMFTNTRDEVWRNCNIPDLSWTSVLWAVCPACSQQCISRSWRFLQRTIRWNLLKVQIILNNLVTIQTATVMMIIYAYRPVEEFKIVRSMLLNILLSIGQHSTVLAPEHYRKSIKKMLSLACHK